VDPPLIARLLVAGRLVVGGSLVVFSDHGAALMVRRRRRRRTARQVLRAIGTRDLVLAFGLLSALSGRGSVRRWALAGAAADAFDLLGAVAIRDHLQPRAFAGTVAGATFGLAQGLVAARAPD
jgi:hypothetical protein